MCPARSSLGPNSGGPSHASLTRWVAGWTVGPSRCLRLRPACMGRAATWVCMRGWRTCMHASEAIKTLFTSTWQLKLWFHTFLIHPHLFNVAIKVAYGSFDAASLNVSAVGSLPFPFPYLDHQPSPSAHIHLRRPSLLPQTQSPL